MWGIARDKSSAPSAKKDNKNGNKPPPSLYKVLLQRHNIEEITGLHLGVISPEEIRKQSAVEITTHETWDSNSPKIGGLFDPRMGVLESNLICPTDGLDYMETPGYFLEMVQSESPSCTVCTLALLATVAEAPVLLVFFVALEVCATTGFLG